MANQASKQNPSVIIQTPKQIRSLAQIIRLLGKLTHHPEIVAGCQALEHTIKSTLKKN